MTLATIFLVIFVSFCSAAIASYVVTMMLYRRK